MDVTLLIWIMGIIGILFILFKTFVRVEVRDINDIATDENIPTNTKDKVIAKTLKDLIKSNNHNIKQLDNITKYMINQEKINKSSDKVFRSLVLRMKQLEDENKQLKEKC